MEITVKFRGGPTDLDGVEWIPGWVHPNQERHRIAVPRRDGAVDVYRDTGILDGDGAYVYEYVEGA